MAKKQLTSEEIFRTMTVPQAVRTMAVPAVMSQIIVLIYNLADTFFIGRTNNPYMVAGVSLILPLFNVCLAIGSMFGTGGGALLPKLLATEQREEGSRVAAYCIRLGLLTAVGFSVLTMLFMRPLLTLSPAAIKRGFALPWPQGSRRRICCTSASVTKPGERMQST